MAYTASPFWNKHYEQKYTLNGLIEKFNSKKRLDYAFFGRRIPIFYPLVVLVNGKKQISLQKINITVLLNNI
jgi:hypothetical protein